MSDDLHGEPGRGLTADRGRIVFDEHIRGQLWSGRVLAPRERCVVITFKYFPYATYRQALDEALRYDVPGIAPLVFLGYRNDGPGPTPKQLAKARTRNVWPKVAMVEVRPDGEHLVQAGRLSKGEVVRLGLGLCDTILAWAEHPPYLTVGLRPETVYVTGPVGNRRYAGATPRAFFMIGNGDSNTFSMDNYDPPTADRQELSADDVVFTVAQLMWVALLGENAYSFPGHLNDQDNTWRDIRRPFTGPPEIGRLLEAVLVADMSKRMKARDLRHELEQLARHWSVELPPFPPPDLAI